MYYNSYQSVNINKSLDQKKVTEVTYVPCMTTNSDKQTRTEAIKVKKGYSTVRVRI